MKIWGVFLSLALLGACGSVVDDDAPIGQSIAGFGQQDFEPRFIALLQAEAPALQIGFVRRQTSGTLLLERRDGAFDHWLSPDGAVLILENGMLHGTRGLGEGLLASELSEPLDHVRGLEPGWSDRFHTYLDGNDQAITRTYRCKIELGEMRDITLGEGVVKTRQMREACRSLDQEFTNLYWVLPSTRQIVQSRQWAGPHVGPISTRIVR